MRPLAYILLSLICACRGDNEAAKQRAEKLKAVKTKAWITTHMKMLTGIEVVYRDHMRMVEPRLPKVIKPRTRIDEGLADTCKELLERLGPLSEQLGETSLVGDWKLVTDVLRIVDGLGYIQYHLQKGIESGSFNRGIDKRRADIAERGAVFAQIAEILRR